MDLIEQPTLKNLEIKTNLWNTVKEQHYHTVEKSSVLKFILKSTAFASTNIHTPHRHRQAHPEFGPSILKEVVQPIESDPLTLAFDHGHWDWLMGGYSGQVAVTQLKSRDHCHRTPWLRKIENENE